MKSLLQDGDECTHEDGSVRAVQSSELVGKTDYLLLMYFHEDLSRIVRTESAFDIIRVIRKGVPIWENGKSLVTQPINKMMTAIHNDEVYPLATHENMKIIVDKVSELEAKVMEL